MGRRGRYLSLISIQLSRGGLDVYVHSFMHDMVTKGEGGPGMNWEIGIDIYTLPYIK